MARRVGCRCARRRRLLECAVAAFVGVRGARMVLLMARKVVGVRGRGACWVCAGAALVRVRGARMVLLVARKVGGCAEAALVRVRGARMVLLMARKVVGMRGGGADAYLRCCFFGLRRAQKNSDHARLRRGRSANIEVGSLAMSCVRELSQRLLTTAGSSSVGVSTIARSTASGAGARTSRASIT